LARKRKSDSKILVEFVVVPLLIFVCSEDEVWVKTVCKCT